MKWSPCWHEQVFIMTFLCISSCLVTKNLFNGTQTLPVANCPCNIWIFHSFVFPLHLFTYNDDQLCCEVLLPLILLKYSPHPWQLINLPNAGPLHTWNPHCHHCACRWPGTWWFGHQQTQYWHHKSRIFLQSSFGLHNFHLVFSWSDDIIQNNNWDKVGPCNTPRAQHVDVEYLMPLSFHFTCLLCQTKSKIYWW